VTEETPEPVVTEETPDPVTPEPSAVAVDVCWVENQNGASTVWRISNPNSVPLQAGTQEKVMFDWTVYGADDSIIQSAQAWDQTGDVTVNTALASRIEVNYYIWNNGVIVEQLGQITVNADETGLCE
ncbi:MAG: hypothetical protein AAFQ52_14705, partial [Chloroflexota bacterium]